MISRFVSTSVLVAAFAMIVAGCGKPDAAPPSTSATTTQNQSVAETSKYDGWWCDEHGVPEDVCTRCNSKLIAGFKAKGDWCKKHNRPESQCFLCHREKEAEFAAQYEARYNKKPPKPEAEAPDPKDTKPTDKTEQKT